MYLDPGTGSIVLQVILASLLGIGVAVKVFWKKIRALFGKHDPEDLEAVDTIERSNDSGN